MFIYKTAGLSKFFLNLTMKAQDSNLTDEKPDPVLNYTRGKLIHEQFKRIYLFVVIWREEVSLC